MDRVGVRGLARRGWERVRRGIHVWVSLPEQDQRVLDGNPLAFSGWAFSDHAPIASVRVAWDHGPGVTARHGLARHDIGHHFPRNPWAAKSGFSGMLPAAERAASTGSVVITVTDERGNVGEVRRKVNLIEPGSPSQSTGLPPWTMLFLHLPKTGGTSIRHMLEAAYPSDLRAFIYASAGIPTNEFASLPADVRAHFRLVFGHYSYGLHESVPGPWRYVTIVREPVARFVSDYQRALRFPRNERDLRIQAEKLTLEQALDERLVLDNQITRRIAGAHGVPFGSQDTQLLDTAREHLDRDFAAVLMLERMAASVAMLEEVMGRKLPTVGHDNRGRGSHPDALEGALRDRIAETNRLDVALYDYIASRPEWTSADSVETAAAKAAPGA
jgi:hypothetical protein